MGAGPHIVLLGRLTHVHIRSVGELGWGMSYDWVSPLCVRVARRRVSCWVWFCPVWGEALHCVIAMSSCVGADKPSDASRTRHRVDDPTLQ
eukprot:5974683-Prymnesium_polylepis.3